LIVFNLSYNLFKKVLFIGFFSQEEKEEEELLQEAMEAGKEMR
jgi:hypothetical protein